MLTAGRTTAAGLTVPSCGINIIGCQGLRREERTQATRNMHALHNTRRLLCPRTEKHLTAHIGWCYSTCHSQAATSAHAGKRATAYCMHNDHHTRPLDIFTAVPSLKSNSRCDEIFHPQHSTRSHDHTPPRFRSLAPPHHERQDPLSLRSQHAKMELMGGCTQTKAGSQTTPLVTRPVGI